MDCRHLPAGRDRARNRPALKACTVQDLWASGGKGAAAGKSVVGAKASSDIGRNYNPSLSLFSLLAALPRMHSEQGGPIKKRSQAAGGKNTSVRTSMLS